jgi:hypothetical protein
MITEYELYSDERKERAAGADFLTIGGVICTNRGQERLLGSIVKLRTDYSSLTYEVGWKKVSIRYLEAYKGWLDVFFSDPHARYSLLSVNRSSADWHTFRAQLGGASNHDKALASVYYQFLLNAFGRLHDTQRWWVYPDAGYFSRDKVLGQVEFLFNRTCKKAFGPKSSRVIRLARALDSKQSELVQLADLLLGCAACKQYAYTPESNARRLLLEHLIAKFSSTPSTQRGLPKLSAHYWVPPDKFLYQAGRAT